MLEWLHEENVSVSRNHLYPKELGQGPSRVVGRFPRVSRGIFFALIGDGKNLKKGAKMLSNGIKRGFPPERFKKIKEPKVHKDEGGYFILTLNENAKVYFEDFYVFLENAEKRCLEEKKRLQEKMIKCDPERVETISYYRARKIIVDLILKSLYRFYNDSSSFAVIMTPWCFGTVMLEKIEHHKELIAKGEINSPELSEDIYFVLKYMDEICKKTLLEMLDLPPEAFKIKWQYTDVLRRYTRLLGGVVSTLEAILIWVKAQGS